MKLLILCLCFTSSLCGKYYHENKIWGQPCLDDDTIASPIISAEEVVRYTKWTKQLLDSFKDEFIQKLERFESFSEFVSNTDEGQKEWLRDFYWFIDEILPRQKLLGLPLPAQFIVDMKDRTDGADTVMPKINAGLKFLEGSLYKMFKNNSNEELVKKDVDFGHSITETIRVIRSVICSMNNYMKHKNLEIYTLLDDFIPTSVAETAGLWMRDTLNYFEYINQLFNALPHSSVPDDIIVS